MNVLEIPVYVEALSKERFIRDAAFLGVTETVAGFELKPFSLRSYLLLRALKHPLLYGELPTPVELAQFLWMNSAEYSLSAKSRLRFLKRCRSFVPEPPFIFKTKRYERKLRESIERYAETLKAVRSYLEESTMDTPPRKERQGFKPDYYSEVAFWVSLFRYQYTPDQVLEMPMKCLYQFLNEARERTETKPVMFNPSDKVRGDYLMQQTRN